MTEQVHKGMKRKTIRKVLRMKIEEWLDSIEDFDVQLEAKKNVIVTGGAISSMLMGERINDFDFYMRTKDSTTALARYYTDKFVKDNQPNIEPVVEHQTIRNIKGEAEDRVVIKVQSSGVASENTNDSNYQYYEMTDGRYGDGAEEYIDQAISSMTEETEDEEKEKYRPIFMSQNAISLSNKVQLVIRFYGSPEEIHRNYDFCHAKSYYDYDKDELVIPAEAMESMMSKTLYYEGSLYPICSLFRLRKFIDRGWSVSAGEILKIAWQVSELDLSDIEVMREQLTGVDAAYFHEIIKILEKGKESDDAKEIDSTYIATIIDRVFNT